ncbi:MAG: aldose 1-epimerase family protein [Oscillospiraceae bacterium]|nr:aldose 1-epimerase family protein [Oscillospiraceae bacterium]
MNEILKRGYIGNPAQLVTLRRVTINEGRAKGTEIIEVKTAGGLELDILPDAGLDIGQCRYKGVNMSWMSKNGYDNPAVIVPYETEFVNTFPGGLLYTCGLRSAGPANRDKGEWHPLHGRYHSLAAEQVCAEIENNEIVVKGTIRETALFGHVLELRREYRIPVFGAQIALRDKLTNLAHQSEEYQLLYHCNFGWPLVSAEARVELPEARKTTPRTPFAATGLGQETTFTEPVPGEEERVFFHEDMEHRASIVNPAINTRMTITWSDTLPILSHWRSMASGDYVCGLEPSNSYIMGRAEERKNGTLPVLKPFESVETGLTITFE